MTARTMTIGGTAYPVVLPNARDPRLHVAAVIISVHVLGQVGLGFWVSVPQILAAIATCAVLEIAITFRATKSIVWPASAMLTGSGVALILRVVGTPPGEPWSFHAVEIFAVVAGLSLLSKYVIRYRGSHVFNPSNIGLVVAFVVLGSARAEPLDFWWAPLNVWMLLAYAVILVGGLLITRRLHLLALAAAFWLVLAGGLGVLAASGHCMVTRWSFAPVCGADYWRVIVGSPEVMIFLFFMITDPKTVPGGGVARIAFGALVAVVSTLMMAPQADEFGTKVGLLAGLVAVSAIRPLLEARLPAARSELDEPRRFVTWLATGGNHAAGVARRAAAGAISVALVAALGIGIVVAGAPVRGSTAPVSSEVLNRLPSQVDPATLPPISVGQDVVDFDPTLAGSGIQAVLVTLAQNLEYERQALLRRDASILAAVDHGDRLAEMQARLAAATGETIAVERYTFEAVEVRLLVPFGVQDGFSLGLEARGTVHHETYDRSGVLIATSSGPYLQTFAVRRATGDRWLTVDVLPADGGAFVPRPA